MRELILVLIAVSSTRTLSGLPRIQPHGGFRACVGDDVVPVEAWRRREVRRLIELVALAHGHRLHREQLMDRLWPDGDPRSVLNNLHQTRYLARRMLDL